MSNRKTRTAPRQGGVYVVVLGTSLIVTVLGLSALVLQRIQLRTVTAAADIRQAQLNAHTAVESALLTMTQSANWRTSQSNGSWFANRNTGAGTCSLSVSDPVDSNLADDAMESVTIVGVGKSGNAVQRCEVVVDPRRHPIDALRTSASSGGVATGQSGSFNWNTVISAYQSLGTSVSYNSLPTATQFEFGQNVSFNTNLDEWTNSPPGLPTATFNGPTSFSGRSACLRIDRSDRRAGAGNRLQAALLKPNTSYQVSIEVHPNLSLFESNRFNVFMITQYADGSTATSAGTAATINWLSNVWTTVSTTITTPPWTEEPANVYLVVNSDASGGSASRFYLDNLHVYENVSGRLFYNQVLGPTGANPNGIYFIDCGGGTLLIERSRILGTLVVLNPGAGSCVANGPIHLAPATPGYPVLLAQGNFAIRATYRTLNEAENSTNFNPSGVPFEFNNPSASATDTAANDCYPSEIQGLVAVSGNLTCENQPRFRGQLIVGGTITGAYSLEYHPHSLIHPPPNFFTYRYDIRPRSTRKTVLP